MAKKEFTFHGKKLDELKSMDLNEFAKLVKSKERRSLNRGFSDQEKILLREVKVKDVTKTHCRDLVIIPELIGKNIRIHNGKEFFTVIIEPEMLGFRLGDFALTRKGVSHSSPGIGATRSSANVSVK